MGSAPAVTGMSCSRVGIVFEIFMKESILITGIAGFVGSALARKLCELNYIVIGIDDLSSGDAKSIPKESIFFKCDLSKKIPKFRCILNSQAYIGQCVRGLYNNRSSTGIERCKSSEVTGGRKPCQYYKRYSKVKKLNATLTTSLLAALALAKLLMLSEFQK